MHLPVVQGICTWCWFLELASTVCVYWSILIHYILDNFTLFFVHFLNFLLLLLFLSCWFILALYIYFYI